LPAQAPVDAGPGDGPIPTAGAVNRDTATRRVEVEEIMLIRPIGRFGFSVARLGWS